MEQVSNLITVKELAERLHIPKSWIYQRTRPGSKDAGIPFVRIGKYVRFELDEVIKFFKMNETQVE